MGSVSEQFDVTINNSTKRCTHANVGANPCWEKEEFVFKKVPLCVPWEGHIVDTEILNGRGQPCKDSDDEHHGEHHWFHGTHLDLELFWHHLLLKRCCLFLQDWVPTHSSVIHHHADLALSVANVRLSHRVGEDISQHGVHGHGKGTQDQHREHEIGFFGKDWSEDWVGD